MYPCQTDPDRWFSDDPQEVESAKDACLDCPLSQYSACRAEGWRHPHGVFGGLSEVDRATIDPRWRDRLTRQQQHQTRQEGLAMLSRGHSPDYVASALAVHVETVRRWRRVSS